MSKLRNLHYAKVDTKAEEETPDPLHRAYKVRWLPRTPTQWAIFTQVRKECARLWMALATMHARIRRLPWMKWPSCGRMQQWAKGKFPGISAQCVQQIVKKFADNIESTTALRKAQRERGEEVTAKYPWRDKEYFEVTYTNQDAKIHGRKLRLGNGRGKSPLVIRLAKDFVAPGRLMAVQVAMGEVRMIFEVPQAKHDEAAPVVAQKVVGVDLGVNSILAATDGELAIVINGREVKAILQWLNQQLANLNAKIARCVKGSKRRRELVRAKAKLRAKCRRQILDIIHKSTHAVKEAFPNAKLYIGESFQSGARTLGRVQAQQVSGSGVIRLGVAWSDSGAASVA